MSNKDIWLIKIIVFILTAIAAICGKPYIFVGFWTGYFVSKLVRKIIKKNDLPHLKCKICKHRGKCEVLNRFTTYRRNCNDN